MIKSNGELLNAWASTFPIVTAAEQWALVNSPFTTDDEKFVRTSSMPLAGQFCAVTECRRRLPADEEVYAVTEAEHDLARDEWVCWRHIYRANGAPYPVRLSADKKYEDSENESDSGIDDDDLEIDVKSILQLIIGATVVHPGDVIVLEAKGRLVEQQWEVLAKILEKIKQEMSIRFVVVSDFKVKISQ